ncbi:MAG: NAD-dependent succinate-semialdehyde dehydrogenase [Chloroflexi bacterium]|nr:MAG: NAD-dependent succinate-semialdehyde dehydrogenase [Chloroflexota bacterium]
MSDYIFKQLINGDWVDAIGGGTWDLINPATEEVIEQVPFGDRRDAEAAIDAAAKAFETWSRTTPYERAEILWAAAESILDHAESFARITTEESGKPYSEALAEWRSAANYLKWNAEECKRAYGRIIPARAAGRRIHVTQVPVGVVGTITAWNFPVYNLVRAWSAALAAGCTVVGRPSEYTPRSGFLLAAAINEAGAPPGVINCINGDPEGMGQAMLDDPRVRKISFTGSTRVGKLLMEDAARTVTRLSLELGGNAPVIVMPDVDINEMAEKSVQWKYRNCGQVCVSPQRFYVHSSIAEEFIERVAELSAQVVVGDGLDPQTQVGPLINARQRDRVEALVTQANQQGAQILVGGKRPQHLPRGYFYEPTVLAGVNDGMNIYHEEIFGPVLPVMPFDDIDEALARANATEYGLTAFVYTRDLNAATYLSERLEYGMVCINDWLPATPEAPFGGVKQSGIGRECGQEGLEDYMETKTVFIGGLP